MVIWASWTHITPDNLPPENFTPSEASCAAGTSHFSPKKTTTINHHFKNTLLHQHLWEFAPSLIKQVKSLQLHFKSVCTMILTHRIRNILKTAPCRACSTLPNLYSLITVIVFPHKWLCLYHHWAFTSIWTDSVWQHKPSVISVI